MNKKVVWRDGNGKIFCPGDACPKECDDSCPIYLNTKVAMYLMTNQIGLAKELCNKILEIADDYYDPWNNLAGIYGTEKDYVRAKECYLKAHELAPTRVAPLYGLALSCRDLGELEECLKWCDEYSKLCDDGAADEIRKQVLKSFEVEPRHYDKVNNQYIEELRKEYRELHHKNFLNGASLLNRISDKISKRNESNFGTADEHAYVEQRIQEFYSQVIAKIESLDEDDSEDIIRVVYSQAYHRMLELANNYVCVQAMEWLGYFMEEVMNELPKAAEWFEKAYSYDSVEGARCYADMLMTGRGVKKDYEKAIKAYRFAADNGSIEAAFVMGEHFRNDGDIDNAKEYYKISSDLGYEPATIRLNQMNNKDTSKSDWKDYLTVILEEESEAGNIDFRGGYPNIPEIAIQAPYTAARIDKELEDKRTDIRVLFGAIWNTYVGMGMVEIWQNDFSNFKTSKMVDDFIETRGIDELDEYVYDLLGLEFGGNLNDELRNELLDIVYRHADEWLYYNNTSDVDINKYTQLEMAMFNYGMIYQMAKHGMH